MSKPFDATCLPEDLARAAEAQVRAGRFANVEDVVRAGIELVEDNARNDAAADDAAWERYRRRRPSDPRDLEADEALACLNSADPERQNVLQAHVDALCEDARRRQRAAWRRRPSACRTARDPASRRTRLARSAFHGRKNRAGTGGWRGGCRTRAEKGGAVTVSQSWSYVNLATEVREGLRSTRPNPFYPPGTQR